MVAGVIDPDQIRVFELRGLLGLAEEPVLEFLLLRVVRRENLEGDGAVEDEIPGQVDDAHAALPDHVFEPVVADFLADAVPCIGGRKNDRVVLGLGLSRRWGLVGGVRFGRWLRGRRRRAELGKRGHVGRRKGRREFDFRAMRLEGRIVQRFLEELEQPFDVGGVG